MKLSYTCPSRLHFLLAAKILKMSLPENSEEVSLIPKLTQIPTENSVVAHTAT